VIFRANIRKVYNESLIGYIAMFNYVRLFNYLYDQIIIVNKKIVHIKFELYVCTIIHVFSKKNFACDKFKYQMP